MYNVLERHVAIREHHAALPILKGAFDVKPNDGLYLVVVLTYLIGRGRGVGNVRLVHSEITTNIGVTGGKNAFYENEKMYFQKIRRIDLIKKPVRRI